MDIENAINKVTDKVTGMVDKVKMSSGFWQKAGRIALICFYILLAMIPFFVYFMFFAKDRTIDVLVDGEVSGVENNDDIDKDDLKKANKKAKDILKKIKK